MHLLKDGIEYKIINMIAPKHLTETENMYICTYNCKLYRFKQSEVQDCKLIFK